MIFLEVLGEGGSGRQVLRLEDGGMVEEGFAIGQSGGVIEPRCNLSRLLERLGVMVGCG